ncbi:hypothetical protein YDYSY3_08330 [Paenibacillus chitinolyticus]|nr:hypothetical protein YDYSY3_08330 [Paenibacillus chitinolyticus]
MIPKVQNVESIIIRNHSDEQSIFKFHKVVLYNDNQFVLLYRSDCSKILKAVYKDGFLLLVDITEDEYKELGLHFQWMLCSCWRLSRRTDVEYWVVGISFNKCESENLFYSEFKISDEKPLDILPFVVQTGVENVIFSK